MMDVGNGNVLRAQQTRSAASTACRTRGRGGRVGGVRRWFARVRVCTWARESE